MSLPAGIDTSLFRWCSSRQRTPLCSPKEVMAPINQMDATVVVTFHREGSLAHPTLLSLARTTLAAEAAGYRVQWILSLDRSDSETRQIVTTFPGLRVQDRVVEVDFGDLGLSRNNAIGEADGFFVGICDGDDYVSTNWLRSCIDAARSVPAPSIWHPELIILFEGWEAISRQVGQDDPAFDHRCMLVVNPWNSCAFAPRSTFLELPYVLARPGETGFGFEDWHWNCETVAAGHVHRIAKGTMHFVRRKSAESLNLAHVTANALIPPSRLFDPAAK